MRTGSLLLLAALAVGACAPAEWASVDPDRHPEGGVERARTNCFQGTVNPFDTLSGQQKRLTACMEDQGFQP